MENKLIVNDWGLIDYKKAEERQFTLFERKLDAKAQKLSSENYLNILEHYPVYTLGKNADEKNILPISTCFNEFFFPRNCFGKIQRWWRLVC